MLTQCIYLFNIIMLTYIIFLAVTINTFIYLLVLYNVFYIDRKFFLSNRYCL